jgi:hypothetical protein
MNGWYNQAVYDCGQYIHNTQSAVLRPAGSIKEYNNNTAGLKIKRL